MSVTKHPEWDYQSPFSTRYCRKSTINKLFSEETRTKIWRELWSWLAQAQNELGIALISQNQVNKLRENIDNIDWGYIREEELRLRHEVNAHIHAFECVAAEAAGTVGLGTTSSYVQENGDILLIRDALDHLLNHIAAALDKLEKFAKKHEELPSLGLTHYQSAALTTVGKRTCLWAQDLLVGLKGVKRVRSELRFHGIKGSTGSEGPMLTLFGGDVDQVDRLTKRLAQLAGFGAGGSYSITGQTYPRIFDAELMNALSILGAAIHKLCCDIRILQSRGELKERNPMRAERCCSFARFLMSLPSNTLATTALQGFERTLDDSANRRLIIPEAMLTTEAMLSSLHLLLDGLEICEKKLEEDIAEELPFLVLEPLQIEFILSGLEKETAHKKIQTLATSIQTRRNKGRKIELMKMLEKDKSYDPVREKLRKMLEEPKTLVGRCAAQVEKFLTTELQPALEDYLEFIEGFTTKPDIHDGIAPSII